MKPLKCPCINCICIPICRHKTYKKLQQDCFLVAPLGDYVTSYLSRSHIEYPHHHRVNIRDALNPVKWDVDGSGNLIRSEDD